VSSQKGIRRNTRFETDFYNEVETYQNLHKIKTWNKALHLRDRENLQKIEELTSLKKKEGSIFDYMQKKGLSEDTPLDKDMSISTPADLSEEACAFMVYVKREPKCGDPDAPIESFLKKHLNPQICALCQKLKREKENAIQKKEDEEHKKQLAKAKEETHKHALRLNKTLSERGDYGGQPRVNWDASNPLGAPEW